MDLVNLSLSLCTGRLMECRGLPPAVLWPAGAEGSAPGDQRGLSNPDCDWCIRSCEITHDYGKQVKRSNITSSSVSGDLLLSSQLRAAQRSRLSSCRLHAVPRKILSVDL